MGGRLKMLNQRRIRDFGVEVGKLEPGPKNSITDVKGVKVGHQTIIEGININTGVTAVLPHDDNIFREKLLASSYVINGFGKSVGMVQINELRTLETPIILTNTLSVGTAAQGLVEYMLKKTPEIGDKTGTVNPIVCECNDQYLNDIRGCHVEREHVFKAINNASKTFKEGSLGAGRGMSCYGLKGGIGTASRVIDLNGKLYTMGILVMSNFGRIEDFILNNRSVGEEMKNIIKKDHNKLQFNSYDKDKKEKGSIIIIMATDIPMSSHQLHRISKRSIIGLNRTGSYMGNGSGEIIIGFTTGVRINHHNDNAFNSIKRLNSNKIDSLFRAVGESTEEAIYNSMICAETVKGRDGNIRCSLKKYINHII